MNIRFDGGKKITLAVVPTDLRGAFNSLNAVALEALHIDVLKGNDIVVFISKNRSLCKIITSDARGSVLVSRRLYAGKFQQLLTRTKKTSEPLTVKELEMFLNGEAVQTKKTQYF